MAEFGSRKAKILALMIVAAFVFVANVEARTYSSKLESDCPFECLKHCLFNWNPLCLPKCLNCCIHPDCSGSLDTDSKASADSILKCAQDNCSKLKDDPTASGNCLKTCAAKFVAN